MYSKRILFYLRREKKKKEKKKKKKKVKACEREFDLVNGSHDIQFIYKKVIQQRYLKTKN